MNLAEFKRACRDPEPVYYLVGNQEYLRKKTFETVLEQVEEAARSFDWRAYDLESDSEAELVEECRTPPWMSPRRWLFVHNAQLAKTDLLQYLDEPSARTVLILEMPKKPARWPARPAIEMPASVDPVAWIRQRAEAEGYTVPKAAAQTLVELAGDDFQRLESELEKLLLFHLDSRRIDRDSVLAMTFPARDFDIFALIQALAAGRAKQALTVLGRLFESGMSAPQIIAMLHWSFRRLLVARELIDQRRRFDQIIKSLKIWSYRGKERQVRSMSPARLRRILLRLHQTDRLAKSTSLDERSLIERLIVDTCRS